MDHGALGVVDGVPEDKVTSFPLAVKRKENETVVFSWSSWPFNAVRGAGMKKAFGDRRMNHEPKSMRFAWSMAVSPSAGCAATNGSVKAITWIG